MSKKIKTPMFKGVETPWRYDKESEEIVSTVSKDFYGKPSRICAPLAFFTEDKEYIAQMIVKAVNAANL